MSVSDFVKDLFCYLGVVQLEGGWETAGKGFIVSGQPAADGTSQVTVAVKISWQRNAANTSQKRRI